MCKAWHNIISQNKNKSTVLEMLSTPVAVVIANEYERCRGIGGCPRELSHVVEELGVATREHAKPRLADI
jgi:hypothetical protein